MTNERRFKPEYARELFRVAKSDLDTAVVLQNAGNIRKENVLFHIQQAIEKGLKSAICAHGLAVPLTHELDEIARRLPNFQTLPGLDQLYDLSQFATIRRYEEGVAIITEDEIKSSVALAGEVLSWCEAVIATRLG